MSSDPITRHRARLDTTMQRFDQLRRTYADIPEAEYDAVVHAKLIYGLRAITHGLSEAFGKRPLVEKRSAAAIRAEREPMRVIGGTDDGEAPRIHQPNVRVRQTSANKRVLAMKIRRAVLAHPIWKLERVGGAQVLTTHIGELEVLRTTRSSNLKGMPGTNGIDIWTSKGKVFSIWWNDDLEEEIKVIRCDNGDWHTVVLTA